jgi:hypothetical protein
MLARNVWLRVPVDLLQEEVVPSKVERVTVPVADLMFAVRRVHDEASDTLRVVRPEAGHNDASIKGPVRGHAKGHEGVVIDRVKDGVSVHGSERNADHGKAAIIGPVEGRTKGFVGHCCVSFLRC